MNHCILVPKKMKPGNQPLTRVQQNNLVSRLEPYLKGGMSIRKACIYSGVSRSTLYRIMDEREDLRDQISRFQLYLETLTLNMVTRQLMSIHNKQIEGEKLSWDDLRYLMWFATNSRYTSEEFGRSANNKPTIDPQLEYMRLVRYIDDFCENS